MSTETLVKVPNADAEIAYAHFREVFFPQDHLMGPYFWAFVGCTKNPVDADDDGYWEIPERAAHYVNLLKGPHYYVYIKAYYANHPWK